MSDQVGTIEAEGSGGGLDGPSWQASAHDLAHWPQEVRKCIDLCGGSLIRISNSLQISMFSKLEVGWSWCGLPSPRNIGNSSLQIAQFELCMCI
jgi:hypothetical protein